MSPLPSQQLLIFSFMLILLCCAITCDQEDYDSVQIVDDYNEPIPHNLNQPRRHRYKSDEEDGGEEENEERPNSKIESDHNHNTPEAEDGDHDAENTPLTDDDGTRVVTSRTRNTDDQMPDEEIDERPGEEPASSGIDGGKANSEQQEQRPKESDHRSLLVKVYRGPTKQINKKPFASWGYFVKYPSENNTPSASVHV